VLEGDDAYYFRRWGGAAVAVLGGIIVYLAGGFVIPCYFYLFLAVILRSRATKDLVSGYLKLDSGPILRFAPDHVER
jgi:hypothetical protein